MQRAQPQASSPVRQACPCRTPRDRICIYLHRNDEGWGAATGANPALLQLAEVCVTPLESPEGSRYSNSFSAQAGAPRRHYLFTRKRAECQFDKNTVYLYSCLHTNNNCATMNRDREMQRLNAGFTNAATTLRRNAKRLQDQLDHDPHCNREIITEALKFINEALAAIESAGDER